MTPLGELIADEIRGTGPLPFRKFMEMALYHPELGYYRRPRDPFGIGGDFYTNAQLQPVFGRLLAQQIESWRHEMGCPQDFTVVEMGAGRGETTSEIERCLPGVPCRTVDVAGGELPKRFCGVVICNEFFDALPVHSVERKDKGLVEHYVDWGADGFDWAEGSLSDPQLKGYLQGYAPRLAEGQRVEVNLEALDQLEKIARSLDSGYVLTIDYGYTADEIADGRRLPAGSLMSYVKHQASEDVLANPGERDITAHVNFTGLEKRGEELGLSSSALQTQALFLTEIGRQDDFQAALEASSEAESLHLRMQLKTLLFGLGETFRVLVQRK